MWSGVVVWAIIAFAILMPTHIFHMSVKMWFFNKSLGSKPMFRATITTTKGDSSD
jgi:hypothetical protein